MSTALNAEKVKASSTEKIKVKQIKVSQSEFPNTQLSAATRIAYALWENFAGESAAPHDIALAIDMSPTSGTWRNLCGASIAYGLTEGGCNAAEITLSPIGRRIVAPTTEGDDSAAKLEAVLKPRISNEFFTRYHTAKFPKDEIAKNVLVGMGLPKERADKALEILKENGKYAGMIRDTKTGPLVVVGPPTAKSAPTFIDGPDAESEMEAVVTPPVSLAMPSAALTKGNRVFITHGKNKKILVR